MAIPADGGGENHQEADELRCIVGGVADILHMMSEQYDEENKSKCVSNPEDTRFKSERSATMSIFAHLHWITSLCEASTAAFVCSFIYIDRFCTLSKTPVNFSTVKWLTFVSLMVSLKYWHDSVHSNQMFSNIGGYSLRDLNLMEREFLTTIKYDLHASRNEFDMYLDNLKKNISQNPESRNPKLESGTVVKPLGYSVKPTLKALPCEVNMNMSLEYPATHVEVAKDGKPEVSSANTSYPEKKKPSLVHKSSDIDNLTSAMVMHSLADTMSTTLGGCVANLSCAVSDESKENLSGVIPLALDLTSRLTQGMSYAWFCFSTVLNPKSLEPAAGSGNSADAKLIDMMNINLESIEISNVCF